MADTLIFSYFVPLTTMVCNNVTEGLSYILLYFLSIPSFCLERLFPTIIIIVSSKLHFSSIISIGFGYYSHTFLHRTNECDHSITLPRTHFTQQDIYLSTSNFMSSFILIAT